MCLKIAVDVRVLTYSQIRGIGNYLCHILKNWPYKDDKFFFIYESGNLNVDIHKSLNVELISVPEPPGTRFKVWDWWTLPKILRSLDVDIFWSPANIAYPVKSHSQIVTVHDTLLQEDFIKHNFIDNFYFKKVVPFFARNYASKIITVSEFSKKRIQKIFHYPANNIEVIYNGATRVDHFSSKEEAQRYVFKKLSLSSPYIFALGASSPWKNTKNLLVAFSIVKKYRNDLNFIIVGIQKDAIFYFQNLAKELNFGTELILMGFIDNYSRNALYKGAELFVYPTLFEGFGLPLLEAMSCGVPVVASNRASIPEIASNAALLVDASDPSSLAEGIIRVLMNHSLRDRLSRRGYENLSRFDWEISALKHREVFLSEVKSA